jgi:hypothetical protein
MMALYRDSLKLSYDETTQIYQAQTENGSQQTRT